MNAKYTFLTDKLQTMKTLTTILLLVAAISATAQVQLDKPLQLTGSGLDARIEGIDTAVAPGDAVPLKMLEAAFQTNSYLYGGQATTGAAGEYLVSIPGVTSIEEGGAVYFRAVPGSTGIPTSLTINGVNYPIVDYSSGTPFQVDIIPGKIYQMIFDGANWQPIGI